MLSERGIYTAGGERSLVNAVNFYKADDFTCGRCGNCCHLKKGVNVALTITDILRISGHLGLGVGQFVSKYCIVEAVRNYLLDTTTDEDIISRQKKIGIRFYDYLPAHGGRRRSRHDRYFALDTGGRPCMFYGDGCLIHDCKPTICGLYPFSNNFLYPSTVGDRDCRRNDISDNRMIIPSDRQFESYAGIFIQDLIVNEYFKIYKNFDADKLLDLWNSIPGDVLRNDIGIMVGLQKQDFSRKLVAEGILKDAGDSKNIWYGGI